MMDIIDRAMEEIQIDITLFGTIFPRKQLFQGGEDLSVATCNIRA